MRSSSMCSIMSGLALMGLALSSAAADSVRGQYTPRYSACICQFGYGSGECVPAVSCLSEGGRCSQSCAEQTK